MFVFIARWYSRTAEKRKMKNQLKSINKGIKKSAQNGQFQWYGSIPVDYSPRRMKTIERYYRKRGFWANIDATHNEICISWMKP